MRGVTGPRGVALTPSRGAAVAAVPSSAPTPRALIDYDFQNVLTGAAPTAARPVADGRSRRLCGGGARDLEGRHRRQRQRQDRDRRQRDRDPAGRDVGGPLGRGQNGAAGQGRRRPGHARPDLHQSRSGRARGQAAHSRRDLQSYRRRARGPPLRSAQPQSRRADAARRLSQAARRICGKAQRRRTQGRTAQIGSRGTPGRSQEPAGANPAVERRAEHLPAAGRQGSRLQAQADRHEPAPGRRASPASRPISASSKSSRSKSPGPRPIATALCRNGSASCPRIWRRPAATATPRRRGSRRRSCATTLP